MPLLFIPSLGDLLELDSDWTFLIDFRDSQNSKINWLCKEAIVGVEDYRLILDNFSECPGDEKHFPQIKDQQPYYLLTMPKKTIIQFRKLNLLTTRQKREGSYSKKI